MGFIRKAAAIAAAVALTAAGVVASPAHADPAPGQYKKYVALGDSFAAVGSVSQFEWNDRPLCIRSKDNYPRQLAGRLGLSGPDQFLDATCAWARTQDYWGPQHTPVPFANPQTQADAVTPDTDLVTLTFGGNPSAMFLTAACVGAYTGLHSRPNAVDASSSYPPQVWRALYDAKRQADSLGLGCASGAPAIAKANENFYWEYLDIVRDVKRRAPHAEVRVVGYYDIIGDPNKLCLSTGGMGVEDVHFIKDYIAGLNDVARRVAADAGAVYVDSPTETNGICADTQREGTAPGILGVGPLEGDDAIPFHPTKFGQARTADTVFQSL
ncbi:SGNH/GDSL hydrolase family protein [Corynebacterium liangguodongii]|uniref:Uncharacterized protein n=1 Tax=Corynebacterium liangguodongii TaxID=2079535 RepID=A0A2S0WBP5_9CORY|nr:SGNH/GDSL hydrolase family protein [Corynebacterium liangguodongii]AWB83174.1 hypothetical protein C3E79_00660 [Corynebacterium liangguodongii]PWB98769.1 SGNH/GDSL hydrolase family protein [Corynebacterium liangguodongii]